MVYLPPEKYESQIGPSSQLLGKIEAMFQTTNQYEFVWKFWIPIALFSERDPMSFESIGIEATQNFVGNLLFL